jgi:CrcB protein
MTKWLILIVAGSIGTIARYLVSETTNGLLGAKFAYGTLAVNLIGCFLIGFLISLSESKFALTPNLRLFLIVGLLGAFTTFSAFMLETSNLIKEGHSGLALLYVLASVVVGFLIFRLGVLAADMV